MEFIIIVTLILVITTITVGVYAIQRKISGKTLKKFLGVNLTSFIIILVSATFIILRGNTAYAAEVAEGIDSAVSTADGFKYIGAAISTSIGSIGAGIAVAVTGSAAIGAISEDPSLFGKTLLYLGLAEGIAIYGFIISIMILFV